MLDLETVYKALYDVARVDYDERVFIEGAAGGTGLYAVACAALRGARVTGLVSTEEKGRLVLARGGLAYVNRKDPALAGAFVPVPRERAGRASWLSAGRKLLEVVRDRNGGALIDVVVSSVGRDLFPRMIDLLAPSGRLVFYGATSGYTLTFLGKPGNARAGEMMRRAGLRPHHGVLVYYGSRDARRPGGRRCDQHGRARRRARGRRDSYRRRGGRASRRRTAWPASSAWRRSRATPRSAGPTPCRTTTWTPTAFASTRTARSSRSARPSAACWPPPTIRAATPT